MAESDAATIDAVAPDVAAVELELGLPVAVTRPFS